MPLELRPILHRNAGSDAIFQIYASLTCNRIAQYSNAISQFWFYANWWPYTNETISYLLDEFGHSVINAITNTAKPPFPNDQMTLILDVGYPQSRVKMMTVNDGHSIGQIAVT